MTSVNSPTEETALLLDSHVSASPLRLVLEDSTIDDNPTINGHILIENHFYYDPTTHKRVRFSEEVLKKEREREKKNAKSFIRKYYDTIQSFLYITLEYPKKTRIGKLVFFSTMFLIVLSTLYFVLSTEPSLSDLPTFQVIGFPIELLCETFFVIEYLLRIFSITAEESEYYHKKGPLLGRILFVFSFFGIIDFMAIMPSILYLSLGMIYFVEQFLQFHIVHFYLLRDLMILRVLRLLRLLKAERYFRSFELFFTVLKMKRKEIMTSMFIMLVTVLFLGSVVYYAEKDEQPDDFGSILAGIYWAAVALSHGNIMSVPLTSWGKILNTICGIFAIAFVALPTSLLGSAFMEELAKRTAEKEKLKAEKMAEAKRAAKQKKKDEKEQKKKKLKKRRRKNKSVLRQKKENHEAVLLFHEEGSEDFIMSSSSSDEEGYSSDESVPSHISKNVMLLCGCEMHCPKCHKSTKLDFALL